MRRVPGWVAREDRKAVSLDGSATLSDGREIAVSLSDLSRDGCRVKTEETLKIGEQVRLDVAQFEGVSGTVRWSLFGVAGVRFLDGDPA